MARPQATPRALAVARGDEPADTLITGGRVFADATREWVDTSLAIADGVIAGWGEREAAEVIDVDGAALTPGFIDAHMHLESTKLWIDEFVATVLPAGTTAVAADPHELANVLGSPGHPGTGAGGRAAADHLRDLRLQLRARVASSSRPGPTLDAADIAEMIERYGALGVAEVMNFPGVIAGDEEMLARVAVAGRLRVDGHSPGVVGAGAGRLPRRRGRVRPREHAARRRPRRSGARGCGCSCARARRARTWWRWRPSSSPTAPTGGALHRRSRTRHAAPARPRQRLRPAGGRQRDLGDRGDPAGQHQPGPLPRLRSARQPRARATRPTSSPSIGARDLGARARLAARAGRVVTGGALVPGAVPAAPIPTCCATRSTIGALPRRRPARAALPPGTPVRAVGVRATASPRVTPELEARPDADLAHAAVVERHRATGRSAGVRDRLRPAARRDRLDRRPRRAQPRRVGALRGRHGSRGRPAGRARRRPAGGARRRRPRRAAAAARRPDERRGGGRGLRSAAMRSATPRPERWASP